MNIQLSKAIRDNFVSPFSIVIYLLTTMILLPYRVEAQVVNWDKEFDYGFTKFQQGNWEDALFHLEKIVNALSSLSLEADAEGMKLKFMDIRKRTYKFPKLGTKSKLVAIPTTSGTG